MVLMGLSARCQFSRNQNEEGGATLLGLYDAIEAVKTMEPLTPSLMNALAAALAQKKDPNN